jgi:pimeloyl-ACP methyl ester carboxylesterase
MDAAKPVLLFVPGAWHSPSCYDGVIKILESQHGYRCETVTLATVGPVDPAHTDADSDVRVIGDAIKRLSEKGDVMLIAHSYGGIPAMSAAYAAHQQQSSSPSGGRLVAIALVCAFLYPPQTALIGPLGNQPAPFHKVDSTGHLVDVGDPGPETIFYNDLPADQAAHRASLLKPHSWHSKAKPPSAAGVGWWDIPTSYLICEKDNAIPVGFQRKMLADANETLATKGSTSTIRDEVVESGHSPFLSMPERVVDFIRRSAGEEVGRS